ncbi:hypothetical protein [Mesoflavibacter sp. CH_XMU1404-2]|uniref:hypothetical protein n=1 Tax=Mesoflavibacter sp. CH_XMU1404-2 TaxID=3107766 RepID=UPI00300BF24C
MIINLVNKIDNNNTYLREKKCGWFCRKWKKLATAVVTLVTAGPIAAIGYALTQDWSMDENKISLSDFMGDDAEISEKEARPLDIWVRNNFLPKYDALLKEANTILDSNSLQNQLSDINNVLDKIYLVKKYVALKTFPYQTPEGRTLINDYVQDLLKDVEDVIATILDNSEIEIEQFSKTVSSSVEKLEPILDKQLITNEIINYNHFSTSSINYKVSKTNTSDTVLTINDAPTDLNQTINANTPDTVSTANSSSLKLLGWSIFAFGVVKVLTKKNKK